MNQQSTYDVVDGGRYRVLSQLGQGATSDVLLVQNSNDLALYAMKVFKNVTNSAEQMKMN